MKRNEAKMIEQEHEAMNTEITFGIYGRSARRTIRRLKGEVSRIEKKLSRFVNGSEIDRINRLSGRGPVKVSRETFQILEFSKRLYEMTRGAFNVLMGPLVGQWDYTHAEDKPDELSIRNKMDLIDGDDLVLNPTEQSAWLRNPGQSIDLGAIGKGYAGDRCMEMLKQLGIESAVVNLGGNVCVRGKKPDGTAWKVGIRHPRKENELIGYVEAEDEHVVTSGDYERFFYDKEGIRRHHILNPATGYPSESGLISVTVISENGMRADALATSLFVLGKKEGLRLLSLFPGTEAIMVDERLEVTVTGGIEKSFTRFNGYTRNAI